MASTLGILDVLSRLREESERAATALAAQEDTNRGLMQRCNEAEAESGRTGDVVESLEYQKMGLEEGRRVAEIKRQESESRLRRLQKQQARRDEATAQRHKATVAAADATIEGSKIFRVEATESVRHIEELRARLQEKRRELERVREQAQGTDEDFAAKTAARDKVKAEVALKLEAVAAACSKAEEIEEQNKAVLEKARRVEEEIDETREAQEEMQEMAVGLQKKNVILRNELRHLKRSLGGETSAPHPSSSRGYNTSARSRSQSRGESRHQEADKRHFYHHSAAPQGEESNKVATAATGFEDRPPHQRQHSRDRTDRVRAPFSTAATAMTMPEFRLSSPHPGGRSANSRNLTSLGSRDDRTCRGRGWRDGADDSGGAPLNSGGGADSDGNANMFEYQA